VLEEELFGKQPAEQRGGYAFSAKILDKLNKNKVQSILEPIEQTNEKLAQELKKHMKKGTSRK